MAAKEKAAGGIPSKPAEKGASQQSTRIAEPERDLVVTCIIDAPRALVFQAWSDAKHLARWWGPAGWTNPVCEVDLRPGGVMKIVMRSPDGVEHPMRAVFQEVVPLERIVFITSVFEDEKGVAALEVHNTVTFADQNGKTNLIMHARVLKATPQVAGAVAGMQQGWTQSLDRLAAHVTNQ